MRRACPTGQSSGHMITVGVIAGPPPDSTSGASCRERRSSTTPRRSVAPNAAYEAYRARGVIKDGRRFGRPPNAFQATARPTGKINVTDLDSGPSAARPPHGSPAGVSLLRYAVVEHEAHEAVHAAVPLLQRSCEARLESPAGERRFRRRSSSLYLHSRCSSVALAPGVFVETPPLMRVRDNGRCQSEYALRICAASEPVAMAISAVSQEDATPPLTPIGRLELAGYPDR